MDSERLSYLRHKANEFVDGLNIDEIYELCDEIDRLRALTEWHPIETAPKDGTRILAWFVSPQIAYWHVGFRAWYCTALRGCIKATHWQPLPEPPKEIP